MPYAHIGPDALRAELWDAWQATRAGRDDVPDLVRDDQGDPSAVERDATPADDEQILILTDREDVAVNRQRVDMLHIYHPEAGGVTRADRGFKEEQVTETIQIDIDLTDRTTPDGERLSANTRLTGDRDIASLTVEPPYPGILGETMYVLETLRRGFGPYDTVDYDPLDIFQGNSNASASVNVELEIIARNTVQ